MKISFATTQSGRGSTMIGRVLPLAVRLSARHDVHVLGLREMPHEVGAAVHVHEVGHEPFVRTSHGKVRKRGIWLVLNMLTTALKTAGTLVKLKPDIAIIVKTLPANVLGVRLARLLLPRMKIVVDVDDFELTANQLRSISQRAAVHWSERRAVAAAAGIVAASPFLADHMHQLSGLHKKAELIPTGFTSSYVWPTAAAVSLPPRLLYIGSISYSSGHRVDLLPAIVAGLHKRGHKVELHIAGDGDDVAQLGKAFSDKGLASFVEWSGRFSGSDVVDLVRGISLIIDPIDSSIAQRAKSSFRVALALEAGVPVVSSNVGIRPFLIPRQLHNRFFADPEDVESYVIKIADLLQKPLTDAEKALFREAAALNHWDHLASEYENYLCQV